MTGGVIRRLSRPYKDGALETYKTKTTDLTRKESISVPSRKLLESKNDFHRGNSRRDR